MNPMMPSGMKARYKIPLFIPLAGFSPNCCAVFVQMEHCAWDDKLTPKLKTNIVRSRFKLTLKLFKLTAQTFQTAQTITLVPSASAPSSARLH
jgi:hypothetical protein